MASSSAVIGAPTRASPGGMRAVLHIASGRRRGAPCGANHCTGAHATHVNHKGAHASRGGARDTRGNHAGARHAPVRHAQGWSNWAPRTRQRGEASGGRPGQHAEGWCTWASRARKRGEACGGRPECGGEWAAKTEKRPPQQPAQPQYTNYWAPLTRKRHQQEHGPQRPTERRDPTQHAKGRTGDCPGPRKETATRRNVTQGGGGLAAQSADRGFFVEVNNEHLSLNTRHMMTVPRVPRNPNTPVPLLITLWARLRI